MKVEELDSVFADVTPIPQDDGPHPVCAISYKDDFRKAYDYMRAILNTDEQSGAFVLLAFYSSTFLPCLVSHSLFYENLERALELTAICLKFNPANYTVWHFRRQCLTRGTIELSPQMLQEELELATTLGGSNPKNYQIWYHRRALLEACGLNEDEAEKEIKYIATVLEEDAKNYHVRCWLCILAGMLFFTKLTL